MKPYAFGVDIGGTTIKMGFFGTDGKFLDKWEITTRTENNGEKVLPDIARSIKKKLKDNELTLDDLEGVGIGVPGPVLSGGIVDQCVNLGWGVIDVRKELSSLLDGVFVAVGNDANVAALGEQWNGGGKGFDNVVMVTLGCGCGKKGCLEQYGSATGVVRLAHIALEANPAAETPLRNLDPLTAKDVFDYAKTGDEFSLSVIETVGKMLGEAIAHITCVVDPDVIVIGGGVSRAGQILLDAVEKYYKPAAFHASRDTDFKLAVLGNDAGMYGAVRMILNK